MDAKWAFDLQTSFLIYSVTAMPTDYWVQYPGALSRDQLREQGQPETPVDAQHVGEWQTAEDTVWTPSQTKVFALKLYALIDVARAKRSRALFIGAVAASITARRIL